MPSFLFPSSLGRRSYGAGLLVYDSVSDKLLLTRRSKDSPYPGWWDFPGGHAEAGETLLEAALREAHEEAGELPEIAIIPEPYWTQPSPNFAFASFLVYLAPTARGWEPHLNFEHDRWGWFSPDDLPDQILPGTRQAVLALLEPS